MGTHLDFEKPLAELEEKILQLREFSAKNSVDMSQGVEMLQQRLEQCKVQLFSSLTPWQRVQLARHPDRPYPQDYINLVFDDFLELCGDRRYADDRAIIGGFAKLDGMPLMVIGTCKGRDLKSNVDCNFGCAHPEGYRKALRLMQIADKAGLPIICLVDTPGAYPGISSEERHIGEALAVNIRDMFKFSVPIIAVITGEGGSGGALALACGNKVLIQENAYYSVITPEGCAAILWRDSKAVPQAAEALRLTSGELVKMGLVDEMIREPETGAHRDHSGAAELLKESLKSNLESLKSLSAEELKEQRYQRFRKLGIFNG